MTRTTAGAVALLALELAAGGARAQEPAVADAPPAETAPPPSETTTPGAVSADERADTAQADALAAPPREEPPGELPPLLEITRHLVQLVLYVGWPQAGDLDDALLTLGYGESPRFWGMSVTAARRVAPYVWLGGQVDLRTRIWARQGYAPATAFAPSGLVIIDARLPLGTLMDLGVRAGGGLGAMVLDVNGVATVTAVPRLHLAAQLSLTVYEPFRMFVQLSADYAESLAVNDYGHTVSFSVAAFGLGFEGRI